MNTNELLKLLPELGTFVTVVDAGSLSEAGRRLQLPPSSISRAISKLEDQLSSKLLERTTRSLALTPIGRDVYEQALSMMDAAKAAIARIESQKHELNGLLRIAAPKALSKHIIAPLIFKFIGQHPALKVQLTASDNMVDPATGEVDLLLQVTESPCEHLVARPVGFVKQVLCTTWDYLEQHPKPQHPQDLKDHTCIALGEKNDGHCWYFANGETVEQVMTKGAFASNHSEIRLAAVQKGLGISIFPEFVVNEAISKGELVALLQDWTFQGSYHGTIYAQYSQSRFVPATIRAFISFLTSELAEKD
ncbi:MAG: LysR family transcriptional regulator [Marinomonas sp.]|nr:MAG: LysR family transcriptional regulator [Marinomonas sp.]